MTGFSLLDAIDVCHLAVDPGKHWRIQREPGHAPQSLGMGAIMSFAPQAPKSFLIFSFFESEFGSIQKNGVLNPSSFQFWGYPRLGPRAKISPSP